eukprot:7385624-Prymnesium_polylepis.1
MMRERGGREMTPAPRSHRPAIARSSELLPAPETPMMSRCSPICTLALTLRKRVRLPSGVASESERSKRTGPVALSSTTVITPRSGSSAVSAGLLASSASSVLSLEPATRSSVAADTL